MRENYKKNSRVKAAMIAASASVAVAGMSEAANIAVNFMGTGYGALGAAVTADAYGIPQADWTNHDSGSAAGSTSVSGVGFAWTQNNDWNQNIATTPGDAEVNYGYIDDSGNNGSLTITGISAWLASVGATSYTVQLVQASDGATGFTETTIRDIDGGTFLNFFENATTGGGGALGGATNILSFTSDTLFMTPDDRQGGLRGTIAGVILISVVPEPSSTALLGLGGLALILRRRR